ncbi:MAG: hypothetical protein NVS2B3_01190 [Vulcanimicrobiaceae bacterium]
MGEPADSGADIENASAYTVLDGEIERTIVSRRHPFVERYRVRFEPEQFRDRVHSDTSATDEIDASVRGILERRTAHL